jgi:hypothetical protein
MLEYMKVSSEGRQIHLLPSSERGLGWMTLWSDALLLGSPIHTVFERGTSELRQRKIILAASHFLGHEQDELAVFFVCLAQQTA